ncbi:MAG: gliding motility-associated C-terminal domain-containing protein, partial [Cyclobacteriaceae bacterium]
LVAKDPVTKQFKSDVLHVNFSLEDDRCVELAVTDKDGSESVRLRARPVNFAGNVQQYFSARSGNLSDAQDTLYSKFCFPDCPLGTNEPIIFDIIAEDFTCPLPLKDTLRIIATVETIKNDAPIFENPVQRNNEFNVNAGDLIEFNLKAKDVNLDSMEMLFHSLEGNTLSSLGIEVDTVENMKGEISLQFNWDTDCNDFPFGLQSSFNWYFVVKDFNECGHAYSDTVFYEVNVQPAINTPPKLRIEGTSLNGSDTVNYTVYVGGEFTIDLIGIDDDEGDLLDIITTSNILTPENLGMDIQKVSGTQEAKLSLSWEPPCTLFETAPYMVALQFVLRDDNVCKNTSADTLNINVNVIPRPNRKPIIETPEGVVSDTLDIVAGESIDIDIKASDSDGDNITLSLLDLDLLQETLGIVFSEVSGQSSVSSIYEWQTNCDLLAEDFGEAVYPFTFVAMDDLCPNWLSDTLTMYVRVSDLISDADFLPPNVFTPNLVDDYNPEFYIPDLPADNCRNAFDRVVIYNRWGREVFESHDRNFSWDGEGMATGVYYMSIYYTRQVIKGTVSIIR